MKRLQLRLSAAALLVTSVMSGSNMPSFAAEGQSNWYRLQGHQIIDRDNILKQEINDNRAYLGDVWCQLDAQHRAILYQAEQDAALNGGRLSYAEQRQLKQEQGQLQWQINAALHRI